MRQLRNRKREIRPGVRRKVAQGSDHLAIQGFIGGFFVFASFVQLRSVVERSFRGVAILHTETVEDFASIRRLRDRDGAGWRRTVNIEGNETLGGTEVLDGKSSGDLCVEGINVRNRIRNNKEIINPN